MQPIAILERAVASHEPLVADDGRVIDPVLGGETQYATPYHALCRAVLAAKGPSGERERHREAARRGVDAALAHVEDVGGPSTRSGMDRRTGAVHATSHRDFFWPAILRVREILAFLGDDTTALDRRIARVPILEAFGKRPPGNWAMVWVSGECMRAAAGLSDTSEATFDDWFGRFIRERMRPELGFYQEPGHSNSYDLFTRLHLAIALEAGYDGAWAPAAREVLDNGLDRSLALQLSDGSLASAHRSTGQTWTLGAQCWLFTLMAGWLESDQPARARAARVAARRALAGFARWQRREGPFSPVENRLPPAYRVGYEGYTADAHYGNLAMGFLAGAIWHGFGEAEAPDPGPRPPTVRVENDPTFRAVAHRGACSVHVNAWPATGYDGHGITDIAFGPGRLLQLVSSAAPRTEKLFFNPGMALRAEPGPGAITVLAQEPLVPVAPLEADADGAAVRAASRVAGRPSWHELRAEAHDDGVVVTETTHGESGPKTLLVPYPRDGGWGEQTAVEILEGADFAGARLTLGNERILVWADGPLERGLDLPYGYENRRGLCGLLRLDIGGEREGLRYGFTVEA